MSVLALCLAGPLQAWGSSARFARRTTENSPTKSGVVGLLASALGWPRTKDPSELAALRFGVRVDQPGDRLRDYQTARHLDSNDSMPVSERFYLADAVFVAGLESDDDALLRRLDDALQTPHFMPYLGRRSCPPSRPLDLGIHPGGLETVLASLEWQASSWYQEQRTRGPWDEEASVPRRVPAPLQVFVDTPVGHEADGLRRDLPVSFDPLHRTYRMRGISSGGTVAKNYGHTGAVPHHDPMEPLEPPEDHDPLTVLGRDGDALFTHEGG